MIAEVSDGVSAEPQNDAPPATAHAGPGLGFALQAPRPNHHPPPRRCLPPVIVKQIWTGNAYRNFNYLIACLETGEALAVDLLDHEKCLGSP